MVKVGHQFLGGKAAIGSNHEVIFDTHQMERDIAKNVRDRFVLENEGDGETIAMHVIVEIQVKAIRLEHPKNIKPFTPEQKKVKAKKVAK